MVNKKNTYVNLETELYTDMLDNIAKQLISLHVEVYEMLEECRNLQQVLKNTQPYLEKQDADITDDIIQL
jgi:hypothetical protein